MSESIENLLSDEFVAFSEKIKDVLARKKSKQDEITAIFAKAKAELKQLDDEAVSIQADWESFKSSNTKAKPASDPTPAKAAK